MKIFWLSLSACLTCNVAFASSILAEKIRSKLSSNIGEFSSILSHFEQSHGSKIVPALFELLAERRTEDSIRYASLMGIARFGGDSITPLLKKYLSDRSWMIRSGTIRVLKTLAPHESNKLIFPLLKDPALVVRSEAIQALEPEPSSFDKIFEVLNDPTNYHAGKPLWVPTAALDFLAQSRAPRIYKRQLLSLLEGPFEPQFKNKISQTISSLH